MAAEEKQKVQNQHEEEVRQLNTQQHELQEEEEEEVQQLNTQQHELLEEDEEEEEEEEGEEEEEKEGDEIYGCTRKISYVFQMAGNGAHWYKIGNISL